MSLSSQITIKDAPGQEHLVSFKVEGFADDHGEEITDLETTIEFEIKKNQLIRMFYFEFKKIAELMKDKDYEEHRKQEFPFEKFRKFESIVIDYLGLR